MNNRLAPTIIKAGLIVGTLDILSAILYFYLKTGKRGFVTIPKYIASAAFGKQAYSAGAEMIFAGFIFHYVIAFAFTIFFFWLYPKITFFSKNNILTGIFYGVFTWAIMNLIIVPLSKIGSKPFDFSGASINALILVVCIGIPLAFMANRFYKTNKSG